MTQLAVSLATPILTQKAFTVDSVLAYELFEPENGLLLQAERVAKGFAKGRNRQFDEAFVDECITEAWYIIVSMLWEGFWEILEKYPNKEERNKFFRMSVGYQLKTYWSYRSKQTVSYLKAKGIVVQHVPVENAIIYNRDNPLDSLILMESVVRNELERRVVEYYSLGNDKDLIARRCGITRNRVKRILTKVSTKLRKKGHKPKVPTHSQILPK